MVAHPLLTSLRSDIAVFHSLAAGALSRAGDPAVPCCDGWQVSDLVAHLGGIHSLVAEWVTLGRRPNDWPQRPPAGANLRDWARASSDRLLDAVATVDPETPCSTWSPYDQSVGFWVRRMAHETMTHRIDLEQSLGIDWEIEPLIAVDGIDEVLTLWLTGRMPAGMTGSRRSVRVTAFGMRDDIDFDRVVRPFDRSVHYAGYEPSVPVDAELSGPASAVWAWCWGRSDEAHPFEVVGDVDAVRELREILAASEQ